MYTPFIRGKQYELLGLRDNTGSILYPYRTKVSPIIEPIKLNSTLTSTLNELKKFDINFTLIINPTEGDLKGVNNINLILQLANSVLSGYNNYQLGIINYSNLNHNLIVDLLNDYNLNSVPLTFIHNVSDNSIVNTFELYINPIRYNVINLDYVSSRFKNNFESNSLILLKDHFQALDTNKEYLEVEESDFSDDFRFYFEEGFIGFGDFGTIGSSFSEKGFLPYAVAIHLSYYDIENELIKVRHFTSDSNDDNHDAPNKFNEAINKLAPWVEDSISEQNRTNGINSFLDLYNRDIAPHYPGLGPLKKYSLINHIELVLKLIS